MIDHEDTKGTKDTKNNFPLFLLRVLRVLRAFVVNLLTDRRIRDSDCRQDVEAR